MAKSRQEEIVLARMIDMQNRLDIYDDAVLIRLKKQYKIAAERLLEDVKKAQYKTKRIWTNTRLTALLEEAQITHQAIVGRLTGQTAEAMVELGAYSYKTMNNIVGWDGKVAGYNNVSLSPQQMYNMVTTQKLAGKKLDEWMGGALFADVDSIKREISQGLIRGEGYSKMLARLKEEIKPVKGSRHERDLETIVKTYTQAINGKAQQDVYNANDIVNKVEWSAIMETGNVATGRGTCPRCIALDGQSWDKDNMNRPPMPLHARCRCMFVPVTKTWKELGFDMEEMEKSYQPWTVRDNKGNISEHGFEKDYADWFKTRNSEFQDKAIGPKRAQLYRDGKIQLKDLVDSKGNLILLSDLPGYDGPVIAKVITKAIELSTSAFTLFNVPAEKKIEFIKDMNAHTKEQLVIIDKFEKPASIAYSPASESGVYYFGTKKLVYNDITRGSATLRHEYGHHIDNVAKPKGAISWSTGSKEFKAAMEVDSRALKIHPGEFDSGKFWGLYEEFVNNKKETGGLEDILDAMSGGKFGDAGGLTAHGSKYFSKDPNNARYETFANLWEIYSKKDDLKRAKELFPNTVKAFDEFIKSGGK